MSDVKWIKLRSDMFTDNKIKFIERGVDGDKKVLLWIFMLMESSKSNNAKGLFFIHQEDVVDFMAKKHKLDHEFVKSTINLFEKYMMIKIESKDFISVLDFSNYAKVDRCCVVRKGNMKDLRLVVFERDGYECVYCGCKDGPFEADHVLPKSRGGLNDTENLVCSCRACNRSKKDRTPDEWRLIENG